MRTLPFLTLSRKFDVSSKQSEPLLEEEDYYDGEWHLLKQTNPPRGRADWPVSPNTCIYVTYACGVASKNASRADNFSWTMNGSDYDITTFKVAR